MEYSLEYSKKQQNSRNIGNFGIWNIQWNIPGILQKNKTGHGGVMFNQACKCMSSTYTEYVAALCRHRPSLLPIG